MAAGNITLERSLAIVESDTTERIIDLPGMASILNVGPAEVFIGARSGVPTTKVQVDGFIFLPVNVPVPLPREMRKVFHKTASGVAVLVIVTDVR